MQDRTDVVIIGAGPYGLSLGAHLAPTGLRVRQFGSAMQAWKTMPKGMFLKSQGFASSLSDPGGTHTLEAYCRRTETPYADYGVPVALDTFVAYGEWFARELLPDLEDTSVVGLAQDEHGFRVELADGEVVHAPRVVVAVGLTGAAAIAPGAGGPARPAGLAHQRQERHGRVLRPPRRRARCGAGRAGERGPAERGRRGHPPGGAGGADRLER